MKDLNQTLIDHAPRCVINGKLSKQVLADMTGTTRQNVGQQLKAGFISADMARTLIAKTPLTADQLLPFIR